MDEAMRRIDEIQSANSERQAGLDAIASGSDGQEVSSETVVPETPVEAMAALKAARTGSRDAYDSALDLYVQITGLNREDIEARHPYIGG